MKLAACLITKNSEATLEACLDSIRPFVDGVFVYDTGSTDGTLKLIERMNELDKLYVDPETGEARKMAQPLPSAEEHCIPLAPITVERGEWRDDFAWAREQSFAMPDDSYDWLLWLDDDDTVEGAQWLRQLAATAHREIDGFVFLYDYARDEHGNTVCVLWRERLMRRSAGYSWRGAVHEVLVPPEGKAPALAQVPPEQVRYVHHRPPDRYPPTRNLEILLREAERVEARGEDPDPRTLAYIGTEHLSQGKIAEAVPWFERYLAHPGAGWSDERMQVQHKLATCLRLGGNPLAAVEAELAAFKERHDWGETHVGLAECFAALGNWPRVEYHARQALEIGMPRSPLILNPLEFTFVPFVRLSEACLQTGRPDEALAWLDKAHEVSPGHPLLAERRAAYERNRYESELVRSILVTREALVRHDENLKALRLMESVPYVVADNPQIVKARADQREMCRHYLEPEEYLRWYREEDKESTLTDEHIDSVAEWFGRVSGLLAGLAEQERELGRKPLVLDLGCNDWWMGEALARKGYRCDGVELNRQSYEAAVARVERFEREATIVHGDLHDAQRLLGDYAGTPIAERYDAVVLFEVIEHVPDPERTLAVCESLLREGGRVYVSTPNGAFENGNLPTWAIVERKGHLRAIPIHALAEMLNARGEVNALEHTNGDRVAFAAYTPKRKRGRIDFYAGPAWERWSPMSVLDGGIGGSETALVRLSACLARDGYEVRVFADTDPAISAGGVIWRPFSAWDPSERVDLLVVSRLPHVFDNPIGARRSALWCHDHSYPGILTEARAERIDEIVTLSDWERERYERLYPFASDKLRVIRNGIAYVDPATNETSYPDAGRPFADRALRCVYSSSADRGLDVLLECWPEIRAAVPEAELHVFYGFETLDRMAMLNPPLLALKARIFELVEAAGGEQGGVILRGRIGQRELAVEMQEARVWSYPTAFLETSCITAMEARAAGLVPVTSDLAALRETVGPHGITLPWRKAEDEPYNRERAYRKAFVERVVRLLTDEPYWTNWHRRALRGTEGFDWSLRAKEWEALVEGAGVPERETVAA